MNTQLLDSLAQIINTLSPQEKEILKQKINSNISPDNYKQENLSWHEFIENTYGSIQDKTFIRHPQGNFSNRELME